MKKGCPTPYSTNLERILLVSKTNSYGKLYYKTEV